MAIDICQSKKKTRHYSKGWLTVVEGRRSRVAFHLVRHESIREIVNSLVKEGEHNPATGEPWSFYAVHSDTVWQREQWRKDVLADTAKVQGAVLAQIREVQHQAWLRNNYNLLLKALQQERELLGLDAPTKVDIEHTIRQMAEAEGLDPDEAVKEAERITHASHR
jgi:hypothetical protein